MVNYFRHKENHSVVCEVFGKTARFGKWVWKGNTCGEVYTYKEVTEEFNRAFEKITQKQFNEVWGMMLMDA